MVGLVSSRIREAENIGYLIPVEEIRLFLADMADGSYEGKPMMFDDLQTLENDALRARLKVEKGQGGLVVTRPSRDAADYPLKKWDIIDSIGFDLIIPPNSFDSLNDAFDGLLQDLEGLNPNTLLVEPLQQTFEENIQPFIDSLDITPLLEDVIARLNGLDGELRGEMDRVNTAYQAMLAAAPDTSISIDVDIGF